MKKITLLLAIFAIGLQSVLAQTKEITGAVTSADDGSPIPGVAVSVKGTTMGTITDISGNFRLRIPQDAQTLVFSFVGLATQEITIGDRTFISVVMESDAVDVEEVMVVAYGTAKKASFTGSAATIKNETLQKRTVASVTKALDGTVAGIQSTSGGGQPGSNASVIIRGFGSINASNSPLYVVDGIPYDGALNAINPNDIETVTVLKDASAASLYGSRAANGVVMITTKKGLERGDTKPVINLKASWGVASRAIKPYDTVDEKGFMEVMYDAYKNDLIYEEGMAPSAAAVEALNRMGSASAGFLGSGQRYNPFNYPVTELIDPTTGKVRSDARLLYSESWLDEITADNPLRQEYQLQVQGGNAEKTKYMTSLSYLSEEGLLKTTAFDRIGGRVSVDHKLTDWAKSGLTANFSQTKSNYAYGTGSQTANVWYSAQFMGPIYPVYLKDAEGKDVYDALGAKQFDYGISRPGGAQPNWNSIATLYDDKAELVSDGVGGRTFFELAPVDGPLKGLKFTTNLGFDYTTQNRMVYYNPYNGNASSTNGRLTKSNSRTMSYTFNQLLNYVKKVNDWEFDVLAGHEYYAYKYNYLTAQKTGFPFGGLYELAAASTIADANSFEDNYKIESYLSRINVNFREKIYLSASYRTDGSSRFHEDARWGDFWSVGASWRISEESFMDSFDFIDNLTLKASYGESGNDNLLDSDGNRILYAWQSLYDLGYPNANMSGAVISSLENKSLKWEKNKSLNIGFETRLFSRLDVSLDYYEKKTSDLLMEEPMALSTGFASFLNNVGVMKNSGVEFNIGTDLIKTNDFEWRINLLGTTNKNEVLELAGGKEEMTTANYITKVGETLNSFYVAKSAGVDPLTGVQLYYGLDADKNEYVTSDINVAANSRQIAGSRIPDIYGSITNDFKIMKHFDLYVLTTYSIGGKVLEGMYSGLMKPMYPGTSFHSHIERRWREPGDITDVPRAKVNSTDRITDRYLVDASYFSIKNITFGYTLPQRYARKASFESVRVFVTGDNLKLFSHLDGMDPQYNFTGGVDYVYSPNRTISLGIDIKF